MTRSQIAHLFFWFIFILSCLSLWVVVDVDFKLTLWLYEHRNHALKDFMANSVFELEPIGGGDFAVFLLISIAILYLLSQVVEIQSESWIQRLKGPISFVLARPNFHKWLKNNRPTLGFLVLCGLFCPLFMVHTTKWIFGRTRPGHVWDDALPYSSWYEWGDFFMLKGYFHGSFPSGHTATAFIFMSLAYPILLNSSKRRVLGFLVAFFAIALSTLMAISRSMSKDHWLSDSVFSFFASWLIIHALYFWGVKMVEKKRYFLRHKTAYPMPLFWEIKVGWYTFLCCIGMILSVVGLRAPFLGFSVFWVVLAALGLFLMVFGAVKTKKLGLFGSL
jgi:membrane-associated phospholipid phosphatase